MAWNGDKRNKAIHKIGGNKNITTPCKVRKLSFLPIHLEIPEIAVHHRIKVPLFNAKNIQVYSKDLGNVTSMDRSRGE